MKICLDWSVQFTLIEFHSWKWKRLLPGRAHKTRTAFIRWTINSVCWKWLAFWRSRSVSKQLPLVFEWENVTYRFDKKIEYFHMYGRTYVFSFGSGKNKVRWRQLEELFRSVTDSCSVSGFAGLVSAEILRSRYKILFWTVALSLKLLQVFIVLLIFVVLCSD